MVIHEREKFERGHEICCEFGAKREKKEDHNADIECVFERNSFTPGDRLCNLITIRWTKIRIRVVRFRMYVQPIHTGPKIYPEKLQSVVAIVCSLFRYLLKKRTTRAAYIVGCRWPFSYLINKHLMQNDHYEWPMQRELLISVADTPAIYCHLA